MSEDYCDDAVHAGRWVAQGRELQREASQIAIGEDPTAKRKKARADAKAKAKAQELRLGAMVKRYLAIKEKALRPTSCARVKCYLEETWKGLHNEPIDSIKRADVALILEDVAGARSRVCVECYPAGASRI